MDGYQGLSFEDFMEDGLYWTESNHFWLGMIGYGAWEWRLPYAGQQSYHAALCVMALEG